MARLEECLKEIQETADQATDRTQLRASNRDQCKAGQWEDSSNSVAQGQLMDKAIRKHNLIHTVKAKVITEDKKVHRSRHISQCIANLKVDHQPSAKTLLSRNKFTRGSNKWAVPNHSKPRV